MPSVISPASSMRQASSIPEAPGRGHCTKVRVPRLARAPKLICIQHPRERCIHRQGDVMKRTQLSSAIGLVLGFALMAPLQAQQAGDAAATTKPAETKRAEVTQLEAVTVSARRRDESLEK